MKLAERANYSWQFSHICYKNSTGYTAIDLWISKNIKYHTENQSGALARSEQHTKKKEQELVHFLENMKRQFHNGSLLPEYV